MKPLKLSIEGLHSFKEKQEIDFSQVCDTGLFGIFGNTGSGKSTILDAITLALYGAVFRAPNRTLGILNSQKDKLEVSFTFAIGMEANRKTYRAERVLKRNKEKRDSVNAGNCRLIEFGESLEKVIAEGSTEVTRKIEEIIGLNMEDFTRSVVLPQGEFAKFLQLKDAERVRMMERIFSLYRFGVNLSDKAKKERDRLEIELGLVEKAIQELGNISAEMITETQQELAQKEVEKNKLFLEAQRIEKEYETANNIRQMQNELEKVRMNETRHLLLQPDVELKKTMLQRAEAAETVKPYYENYQKAETSYTVAQNELSAALEIYRQEEEKNNGLKAIFLRLDKELQLKQPELIEQKTRLQGAVTIENEVQQKTTEKQNLFAKQKQAALVLSKVQQELTDIEITKNNKETLKKEIEAEIRKLAVDAAIKEQILRGVECEKDYHRLLEQLGKIKADLENEARTKASLEAAQKGFETGKIALISRLQEAQTKEEQLRQEKPGDLESYDRKNKGLHQLEIHSNSLTALIAEIKNEEAELNQLTNKKSDLERYCGRYSRELDDCRNKISNLEEVKIKLQDEVKRVETVNLAAGLADALREGDPCPVCGSAHHPVPAKSHLVEIDSQKNELLKIDEALNLERQNFERTGRELVKYQTSAGEYQEQCLKLQEKANEKTAALSAIKENIAPELREKAPLELSNYILAAKKTLEKFRDAITAWNKNYEGIRESIKLLKDEQINLEKKTNDIKGQLIVLERNFNKLAADAQEVETNLVEKQIQYTTLQKEMNVDNFQEKLARMQSDERKIESLRLKIEAVSKELLTMDQSLDTAKQQKENYGLQLKELETGLAGLIKEITEREAKIREVAGDRKPFELMNEITGALEKLAKELQAAKTEYESSETLLQKHLNQKTKAHKQVDLFKVEVETTLETFKQKIQEKGFISQNELQDSFRTDRERSDLKNTILEFEDTVKKYKAQIDTLLEKLDGAFISDEQWEKAESAKKEISAGKEKIIEDIARISTSLEDALGRFQKTTEYRKSQQNLLSRKSMADEVCKLLQGDAFVAYIAEEHMRYILKDASGRLEMLTNGRYVLKMDENKDFIIYDNTNGGLARPVSSLSGGETFLVSLSLSLALSGKIQLNSKNPLEFFFLDEGFGTLDPQLLELVMDSLEKLKHGNLTIGIISHVPELRNRIPRRIIVTPASVGGDGSRVRIEKA